jgi:hypothetical protein
MIKEAGALLSAGCIAAIILAVSVTGTATAAIVPFDGTEYSWLHLDIRDEPAGDWLEQIDDTISVRTGDSMQFQNRWYNSLPGTADIRISYGGGQPYTCVGADESVYYGLNFGNYYPSSKESVPFYSTVVASPGDPNSLEEYSLVINHQYVYNGLKYGSNVADDKWKIRFKSTEQAPVTPEVTAVQEQQNNSLATVTPIPTVTPTPTAIPVVTDLPTPSPGFGIDALVALACIPAIVSLSIRSGKKRRT